MANESSLGVDISDPMDLEEGDENLLETKAPTLEDQSDQGDQSSNLSDGPDLVKQTALQQFAIALQDAQTCCRTGKGLGQSEAEDTEDLPG